MNHLAMASAATLFPVAVALAGGHLSAMFLAPARAFVVALWAGLGVALLNVQQSHGFVESAVDGFGAAAGFSLVLVLFAAVRERVAVADVPAPFQGNAISLITAGLMSMAFMGFAGLVSN